MSSNLNSESGVTWGRITSTGMPTQTPSTEPSPLRSFQENFVSFASLVIVVAIISYLILR